MQIQGVIFDMDGTLGDTVFVSAEAISRTVFELTGKRYAHSEIIALFGPTEQGILKQLVPHELWEQACRIFLEHYLAIHHTLQIGAYPGIQPVLDLLQHHRVRQAIVTGKSRQSAEISLRYFNLNGFFETMETGSITGSAKQTGIQRVLHAWQIPAENVLYVGDAVSDVGIARSAGVQPISASWAATADPIALAQQQPYALFEQIDDFKTWLANRLNRQPCPEQPYVP
jgi:pyrophosphatase PpaX